MAVSELPHSLAALNAITLVLLLAGYGFIRAGNHNTHRACMIGALIAAALFLTVYVYYHLNSGFAKFGGEGLVRPFYFTILIIHVLGAVVIVPLVPITVYRAVSGDLVRHKRLVRWTWPLWVFVSASGIIVYVMTIHLFPFKGAISGGAISG